jgi:hypothetical protein
MPRHPENTLSIFFMIRSAHCTAAATSDQVIGSACAVLRGRVDLGSAKAGPVRRWCKGSCDDGGDSRRDTLFAEISLAKKGGKSHL